MLTRPSACDLIEAVVVSLSNDVLPSVNSEKAQVVVVMMQAVLQTVMQRIPVEQQIMAAEQNQMTALFRDMAGLLGSAAGPEADRIRQRGNDLGSRPDLQVPAYEDNAGGYRLLSQGLVEALEDLDALIRGGNKDAEAALPRMREYLGPRVATEFATNVAGAGMAGRG
jgi:hypothetical protein